MIYKAKSTLVATFVAASIAGCGSEPPKCSDEATFALLQQLIVEQIGGRQGASDKELRENFKIEFPRPSEYNEKIKRYSCEAKIVVGGTMEMPISYQSQLDDKGQHIVSVSGITSGDQMVLGFALSTGIAKGRGQGNAVLEQPKAAAAPLATSASIAGTWKGSLEGDGEMTVKPVASGFDVNLSVTSPSGCGGAFVGTGTAADNVLKLMKNEGDQVCTISITFSGEDAEIEENGCSYFHGAACGFSGSLKKVK